MILTINNIFNYLPHLEYKIIHRKDKPYQFSTCENSAIMLSLLSYETKRKPIYEAQEQPAWFNCQQQIQSSRVRLTVTCGKREPWNEDTFWSNAKIQPQVTDSHLGTATTHQRIYKLNWQRCTIYNITEGNSFLTLSMWVSDFIK